jgi:LPXTG-motif cell wall-anchored protein
MKHVALLASIYALIVVLVLPGSILAQEEAAPTATETTPAEAAPAEPAPAEPAPAPAEATPAEPAPPEPRFLADEGADSPDPQPKAIAAASGSVTIADFSFSPATITINQGDTVTWNNNGPTPHSATASDGSFDTGILKKGGSGSHTFSQAGSFSYFCKPHPFMKGTVVVQAAQTGGGDTSGSGSGDTGGAAGTGGTGAEAAQSDGGPTLPNSGSDSGALLVLGALMLVLGIAVHRRTAEHEPRAAGRIGW